MPPQLAAIIYLSGVVWLFRRDFRERPNVTSPLWLPFFWVILSGGRFVSQWPDIFGVDLGGVLVEEGSPVDPFFFSGIIISGIYVLYRRQVNWSEFMRNNRWVTINLLYCLPAITWSDFTFVVFKRC